MPSLLSSLTDTKPEMSRDRQVDANETGDIPLPKKAAWTKAVLIIRFIVDVILVAGLSVLAYFMRFGVSVFRVTNIETLPCKNDDRGAVSQQHVSDTVFVSVLFAAPIGGILIGELLYWIFGPVRNIFRRIVRFEGCFYLGFLLTSIISDSIGFLIVKPIPAFPEVCQPEGCPKSWINIDDCNPSIPKDEFNNYFRSFPNYRSSASAYAAVYVAWYFSVTFKATANKTLCALITTGCVILCMFASLSDLTTREAHWEDVVVGWFLGICSAIYMVVTVNFFKSRTEMKQQQLESDNSNLLENNKNFPAPPNTLPRVQAINKGFNNLMINAAERNYPLTSQMADGHHSVNANVQRNRILAYDTSTF